MGVLVRIFLFSLTLTFCLQATKSQSTQDLPGRRGPTGQQGEPGDAGNDECDAKISRLINKLDDTDRSITDLQLQISSLTTLLEKSLEKKRYVIRITPRGGNYDQARQMCLEMGGDLLQKCLSRHIDGVSYKRKIQALLSTLPRSVNVLWIGVNDREVEGNWTYLNGEDFYGHVDDGEDLLYYWANGQPQSVEDCGAIYIPTQTLHDNHCRGTFHGMCEIMV